MRSVLFVCTGNICRSPTAEAVLRGLMCKAGLYTSVQVDSAGTHHYHVGEPPDERAQAHARRRGYELCELRARQLEGADYERFDLLLAMDRGHLEVMQRQCPGKQRHKLRLFMEFASASGVREVPDPYHGGPEGFEQVLDLVEDAARGLIAQLQNHLRVST